MFELICLVKLKLRLNETFTDLQPYVKLDSGLK